MKDWKNWLLVLGAVMCLAVLGCSALIERVLPAEYDKVAALYVGDDPNTAGIVSLHKLRQKKNVIIVKHRNVQTSLLRQAQDDDYDYELVVGFVDASIARTEELWAVVVGSEDQPFSIIGILAGAFPALMVGRLLKRKGDFTPQEHDADVTKAKEEGRNEVNHVT